MILSSHIIVASAATNYFVNQPVSFLNSAIIFIISLISHYLLDAIPHWDYKLLSILDNDSKTEKVFIAKKIFIIKDLAKNFLDGGLGLAIAFFIIGGQFYFKKIFMIGIIVLGSLLPDLLEVFYIIFKKFSPAVFHSFHSHFHTNYRFKNQPAKGIILQIIVVAAIAAILVLTKNLAQI